MKNTVVLLPLTEEKKQALRERFPACSFRFVPEKELTAELAREAEILIGFPKPALIGASERLEFLQLSSSGADAYVKPGVLAPGTLLASVTGAYGQAVGEHAFAMTWELLKKLHLYRDDQAKAVWGDRGTVGTLRGATVLVVGLGDIGSEYARLCKAVGAHVIGVKRRPSACPDCVDELGLTDDLDRYLPRADVVCTVLPGTDKTYHLFDAARFAAMKPGSIFLNCGRGTAFDADALVGALQKGPLAAAGSDVTEVEPLPASHPLWQQENMVITPHISGGFHLPGTLERIEEICFANLEAFLSGGEIRNVIDFSTGYKK
ncbi:MAG: D-2-hydroxyacid dehydrogenase [Oscillospiraceae bacterium]|nr:D-2-hydroxyacid dehydrogenase [Oscillospiraceae bacterium]